MFVCSGPTNRGTSLVLIQSSQFNSNMLLNKCINTISNGTTKSDCRCIPAMGEWLTCLHQSYKSYINHKNTHPLCYPLTDQQNSSKLYVFACHLMYESKETQWVSVFVVYVRLVALMQTCQPFTHCRDTPTI
jgi:hypothetical protein